MSTGNDKDTESQIEDSSNHKRIANITAICIPGVAAVIAVLVSIVLGLPWWICVLLMLWAAGSAWVGILFAKKNQRNI